MKTHYRLSFQRAHFIEAINYFEKLKTDCIHIKPMLPCDRKMQGTGREIGARAGNCKQPSAGIQMTVLD